MKVYESIDDFLKPKSNYDIIENIASYDDEDLCTFVINTPKKKLNKLPSSIKEIIKVRIMMYNKRLDEKIKSMDF